MKISKIAGFFGIILAIIVSTTLLPGTYGCGGGGGSGGNESTGYGDVAGGVALENLTTSRSYESSASLSTAPVGASQKAISVPVGKGKSLAGQAKIITDTSVSGTATLYDLESVEVASAEIVSGEYSFSAIAEGTYKLVLTLASPWQGMQLQTYVDITSNGVSTPRPDPLSTLVVAAADLRGQQYGITVDAFDPDMLMTKINDCYETLGDVGIEGELNIASLQGADGTLNLGALAAMFNSLPDSCKTLGHTSFARGRLIAAGDDPVKVTQAMCDILYQLGFVIALNPPDHSFCHPNYAGSPFTADQITEDYCPDYDGVCEWGGVEFAAIPAVVELDRNHPEEDINLFLPMMGEYRIMTMAQAYVDGISVTPGQIYSAMVDADALGLRLCFDSGRGSQYCFGPDGVPVVNQVYGEEWHGDLLSAAATQPPACREILPILCDDGESIGNFAAKTINMNVIKEGIIFKRVHVPWNKTGGPTEWVVFDGDRWAGNGNTQAVRVNITRDDNYEVQSVTQAVDGSFYLGFDMYTNELGTVRPISAATGLEMMDGQGRHDTVNLSNVAFLPGVKVRDTGSHIFGGPPIEINSWNFGVIYDNWQGEDAAPVEVCVSYTGHYTVAQNEDGTCDDSFHYLQWHETTETDSSAYLLSSVTGECALTDPGEEQSDSNPCIEWPLTDILSLNPLEYRDTHTYVYGGEVANPRYNVDADPFYDDFPNDLCNVDADDDGIQDNGDGVWCSESLLAGLLCDALEPTFSWRSYLANPDAPYSIDDSYYRWQTEKQFVRSEEEDGEAQTIACGDSFEWDKIPPGEGDLNNLLPGGAPGDTFNWQASPAANGIVPRNFKARANTYAVGRPNAMINIASLALGGKASVDPNTTFNVIEAFSLIYLARSVETNVQVAEITIPNFAYDHETQQEVDGTLYNETFHATFYRPWSEEQEFRDDFQIILDAFGVPENYLEGSSLFGEFFGPSRD